VIIVVVVAVVVVIIVIVIPRSSLTLSKHRFVGSLLSDCWW